MENALNPSVAKSIGVNTDNLLISQPDSAENLLSMVDTLTKSGSIAVIVVDSVSSVIRKCLEFPQSFLARAILLFNLWPRKAVSLENKKSLLKKSLIYSEKFL